MIPRSHLITLDQVIIGICKTTNSLIVRVVCNVGLTVRSLALLDGQIRQFPFPRSVIRLFLSVL